MKTFTQLLVIAAAAFVVLLAASSNAAFPEGKNIKTSAKQLTSFEKFLIRTFKPEIPLDKILAAEGGNTIQDDYQGHLEWWNVEFPLFLMQLNKLGDEVVFPAYSYEYGWWFCFIGVCDGFWEVYNFQHPTVKGLKSATLDGSVNGTQLRLRYHIPSIEGRDPTYTYEYTDYGQDPPATSDTNYYENASLFITNYTIVMTADFEMGLTGLEVSDLSIDWLMDELRFRYENGTHVFPGGTEEPIGAVEDLLHERLLEYWNGEDDLKGYAERNVKIWLNCFLSNKRNGGGDCNRFFDEPLHGQTFAELIHAFGLNALNKLRAAEE